VPALSARAPGASDHLDRCWLELERKRALRDLNGRIGLASEGPVVA
jgi:hypothetical protein